MSTVSQTGAAGAPSAAPMLLPKLIPALLIIAAVPGCLHFVVELGRWRAGNHLSIFGDGANVWAVARLVLSGRLNVVLDPYFPTQFVGGVALRAWVYPPPMLLLAVPLGLAPLAWAILIYDALSVAILAACLRTAGFGWAFAAAILTSPAALESLIDSQNGALVSGLLIAGLWRAERSPWLGGVMLGLATIKPHLGILIPVYLLARGNWTAILAATITAAVLAGVSVAAFGLESWASFILQGIPYQAALLANVTSSGGIAPSALLMTVFSLAREAGAGVSLAYAAQGMAAGVAILGAFAAGRWVRDHDLGIAILLLLTPLASPYLWFYDMIPLSVGVALLIRAGLRRGFLRGEFLVLSLLWIIPGLALWQTVLKSPSFCPIVVAGVLIYAWLHARAGDAA